MDKNNQTFYLPIRAFGDFLIAATVVKGRFTCKIPILLPNYLFEVFLAIDAGEYFEIVNNIHFKNQPAFFELYKLKNPINLYRLIKDIITIQSAVNDKDKFILDYSSKRLFFTGAHFLWPKNTENIYEGKLKLFSKNFNVNPSLIFQPINPVKSNRNSKILIIPDSRIRQKSIDKTLIKTIKEYYHEITIDIAYFSKDILDDYNKYYSSFKQLIKLINSYDLIISAESLPYHLANYLGKPHFVIYNNSRHAKKFFMTPYMIQNHSYSIFKNNDAKTVIADIKELLTDI
jgi:ADP-heptose:LPS heptosyltransferase